MEIVVLTGAASLPLCAWVPDRRRRGVVVTVAALTAYFCLELVPHGLRWQMVPALLGAVLAVGLGWHRPRTRTWPTALGAVGCLALIALTPITARAFPTPTSPSAVGTTVLQRTDSGPATWPCTPVQAERR